MKIDRHDWGLVVVTLLGMGLRFWNLDFKPLWLDEVITALMTLGRNYNEVPLEKLLSIETVRQIFTLNPGATCPQIAHNLVTQSTHPPLFFCLLHANIALLGTHYQTLGNDLRSLPALFGVGAIAAIYYLNRIAFSKASGLIAAAVMAVSPFGVYLSQEARHYTLPVLLITLSLIALIQIQQDIQKQHLQLSVWLGWVAVNSIGFYVHYFFILAYIAELITLFAIYYQVNLTVITQKNPGLRKNSGLPGARLTQKPGFWPLVRKSYLSWNILPPPPIARSHTHLHLIVTFSLLPLIFFIPWLPLMLANIGRPETNWIAPPTAILPLFQTLLGWLLMVIALPVENYPLSLAIPAGILMLLFGIWLSTQIFKGLKQLWQTPETHGATWTLLCFTACVLLEFFAIVYLMGKDITVVPRYNFVYYPAISALLAASLINHNDGKILYTRKPFSLAAFSSLPFNPISSVLLVGFISSIFVVYGLAFQKPYNPHKVANNMNVDPALPLAVMIGYNDTQDVALGLSFALALDKIRDEKIAGTYIAFYQRSPGYESVWQSLSQMHSPTNSQLNLWLVTPDLTPQDYPAQMSLSGGTICTIDPTKHYRIAIPYQLYRCLGNAPSKR